MTNTSHVNINENTKISMNKMRHKDNSLNGILCGLYIHNEYKVYLIKNCILQVSSQIK